MLQTFRALDAIFTIGDNSIEELTLSQVNRHLIGRGSSLQAVVEQQDQGNAKASQHVPRPA